MKVKCNWWVSHEFTLDDQVILRKKLAEFLQVDVHSVANDLISADIPQDQLMEIIVESLTALSLKNDDWIWMALNGDKSIVDIKKLAKIIVAKYKHSVYQCTGLSNQHLSNHQKLKQKILSDQLPVYCLEGDGSVKDGKPKVIICFTKNSFEKVFKLKTNQIRYGYIIKKELLQDKKLKDHIKITVQQQQQQQQQQQLPVLLTLMTPDVQLLERASNIVLAKANNFRLSLYNN